MSVTTAAHGVREIPFELDQLYQLLRAGRFDLTHEKRTQADVERLLIQTYPRSQVSREHRLGPGDIPDFLVDGRWVVEVKGPRAHRQGPVLRQLERYALHPQVDGIILATAKALAMPSTIGGAPVLVLNLGRAWL